MSALLTAVDPLHRWKSYAAGGDAARKPFAPPTPSYVPAWADQEAYEYGYADAHPRAAALRHIHIPVLAEVV